MTGKQAMWSRRVEDWRASGKTSEAFCDGKEFTAGGLRHWAHRLGYEDRRRLQPKEPTARVARVVVARSAPSVASRAQDPFVVEIGGARVSVGPGFDRETLAALLEVIASRETR